MAHANYILLVSLEDMQRMRLIKCINKFSLKTLSHRIYLNWNIFRYVYLEDRRLFIWIHFHKVICVYLLDFIESVSDLVSVWDRDRQKQQTLCMLSFGIREKWLIITFQNTESKLVPLNLSGIPAAESLGPRRVTNSSKSTWPSPKKQTVKY